MSRTVSTNPPDERTAERLHALARLVPAASHDLSNILTVLAGMVELLDRAPAEANAPGIGAESARGEMQRARALLEQLSTLAKPGADELGAVDARATLAASLPLVQAVARELGVEVEALPGAALVVRADERALVHDFTTRLLAAVEAAADGEAPRVVRASFRADGDRASFVAAHDEGAFELALDVLSLDSSAVAHEPEAADGDARVLLYEPDALLADLARDVLYESGFRVDVAGDLASARARLAATDYAVLLLDSDVERRVPGTLGPLASGSLAIGILIDEGDDDLDGRPSLRKPFRPHALVEFVRALIA